MISCRGWFGELLAECKGVDVILNPDSILR